MLKFYILVSRSLEKVRRHLDYIPKEKIVYVINTLDKKFEKECSQLLQLKGIEYYITKSDGTPAQGKNELLKIFEKSSNDYCVQVDGDDYLTPYGVDLYQRVAQLPSPPDAICLQDQISLVRDLDTDEVSKFPFFKKKTKDYDKFRNDLKEVDFSDQECDKIIKAHKEFFVLNYKYVNPTESHCRVVFFSKKAAAIKFPTGLLIGEDTLHFMLLKNEAFKGNLNLVFNSEKPCTYLYDQTDGEGTVFQEIMSKNWQWMEDYAARVKDYEAKGLLRENQVLERLILSYDTCELDDLGVAELASFKANNNIRILAPSNACDETLHRLYRAEITIDLKKSK